MRYVLFPGKPAVVGHRGYGRGAPGGHKENTIDACLAAAAAGLPWIEIDVQRTADDWLVLRHDWTAPDGSYIADRTAAEVGRQGVPLLAEALASVPPDIGIDVDVKTALGDATAPPGRRTGALVAGALRQESRRRPVLVTSFDPGLLASLRPDLPHASFGLLTWLFFPLHHAIPAAVALGMSVVALHTGSFGPPDEAPFAAGEERAPFPAAADAIGAAQQAGLEVLIWCPRPAVATRYAAAGADALCVDDVPGTLAALGC